MIGRTVSHYRIVAQLGAGGMGVVYRAEDLRLGREVAVKFLADDLHGDELAIQRLRAEARAASALNHGNICTIYDVGEEDGHPFIVMELMKGRTLRDSLERGPLRVHQLVDLGIEIADALQAAHSQGIVHRDIKPGNIFLTDGGHVKILDFGLAKVVPRIAGSTTRLETADRTTFGTVLGTASYMSPEQASGEELDGRTDIFSLGVVLYECATGRHPFPGKTTAVTLAAILNQVPVAPAALNPELPARLQEVINNCLEKDRELRYQSAADVRADLKRVRRDIESGQSRAIERAQPDTSSRGSARPAQTTGQKDAAAAAATPVRAVWMPLAGAAIAAIALVAVATAYVASRRPSAAVPHPAAAANHASAAVAPPPVTPAAGATAGTLKLAAASFDAKSYRAALGYASQVLAADPDDRTARAIRDRAQAELARFDADLAEARRRENAGDLDGAVRALDEARAIDPAGPGLGEIEARLAGPARAARPRGDARTALSQPAGAPAPSAAHVETPAPPRIEVPSAASAAPLSKSTAVAVPPPSPAPFAPHPAVPSQPAAVPPQEPAAIEAPPARARTGADDDDAAIRRVIDQYARAIETKDVGLFRSIKPNLSPREERRLVEGFRAVGSQQVAVTINSIDRRGDTASVSLMRRDTIEAGGRRQTAEEQQTIRLAQVAGRWVIVEIR